MGLQWVDDDNVPQSKKWMTFKGYSNVAEKILIKEAEEINHLKNNVRQNIKLWVNIVQVISQLGNRLS